MSQDRNQKSTMTPCGPQTTPFGAVENPFLLDSLRGNNNYLYRVDLLYSLQNLWGENICNSRQHLYEIVAGTVSDTQLQELLLSYYKRFSAFANYVDTAYLFGDSKVPLLQRVLGPARECISAYQQRVQSICRQYGGEFHGLDMDYAYFSFPGPNFPDLNGGAAC